MACAIDTVSEALAREIQSDLGVGVAAANAKVQDALQRFFKLSLVWRDVDASVTVDTAETEYEIELADDGVAIVEVQRLFFEDDAGVEHVVPRNGELRSRAATTSSATNRVHPDQRWTWKGPATILFNRPWDEAATLRARVILRPALTDGTVPEDIFDQYRDVIEAGAKARLLLQAKKEWYDAQLASFYLGEFNNGIARAQRTWKNNLAHGRPAYRRLARG